MSTQDFLARSAFNDLANSIEQALSDTEGFRDEAENFADLARRGIRLVGVVADLSSFPANPEDGDAVFVESETQIYFWDATSSTWKNSQIIGSAIWGNVQGTLSDQTDLQTALDGKADVPENDTWTPEDSTSAGLTITVHSAEYTFFGGVTDLQFDIEYPATSDTSNALIEGLPNPTSKNYVGAVQGVNSSEPSSVQSSGAGNRIIAFRKSDGSIATNADLSGVRIRGTLRYR